MTEQEWRDARVCLIAADLIEEYGLAKHRFRDPETGAMCFAAALINAGHPLSIRATDIIQRVFDGQAQRVISFNDDLDTTKDEVIALLQSGAYSLLNEIPA